MRSIFSFTLILWAQLYMLGPELVKLPLLWQHFKEHRIEDSGLSFSAFFDDHYETSHEEENCDPDHERLPYHHHGPDCCIFSVFIPTPEQQLREWQHESIARTPMLAEDDVLQGHGQRLIQPPRPRA